MNIKNLNIVLHTPKVQQPMSQMPDALSEERTAQEAYKKGFAARKALLVTPIIVNTEISLNRYSFFETLHDELLPNSKIEISL